MSKKPEKYRDKELRQVRIEIDVTIPPRYDEGEQRVIKFIESETQFSFRLALRYPGDGTPDNIDSIVLDFARCKILDGSDDSYRFHVYDPEADNTGRKAIMVSNETEDSTKFHSIYTWGSNDRGQLCIRHPLSTRLSAEEKKLGRQIVIILLSEKPNNRAEKKHILDTAHFPENLINDSISELVDEGHLRHDNQDLMLVGNPLKDQIGFR